jgi:hypothetical protein
VLLVLIGLMVIEGDYTVLTRLSSFGQESAGIMQPHETPSETAALE